MTRARSPPGSPASSAPGRAARPAAVRGAPAAGADAGRFPRADSGLSPRSAGVRARAGPAAAWRPDRDDGPVWLGLPCPGRGQRPARPGRLRGLGDAPGAADLGPGLPRAGAPRLGPVGGRPAPRRGGRASRIRDRLGGPRRGGRAAPDRPADPPAPDLRPPRAVPGPGDQRPPERPGRRGGRLGPQPSPRAGDRQRRGRRAAGATTTAP